jgi:hypothetical protein
MVRRFEELEARISRLENPVTGYKCQICGITRPADWFIYEVEKSTDNWVTPCCAECARKYESRGPFPPNVELRDGVGSRLSQPKEHKNEN